MGRRVVLVCGPPCAGKSTYVREHAKPGDLVIDYDDLAQRIEPGSRWDYSPMTRGAVRYQRQQLERQALTMTDGTAWVIRTAADPTRRWLHSQAVRATDVVVLDPGRDTAHARARADGRPAWTTDAIDRWYDTATGSRKES
jgi:predicted kinase